MSVGWHLSLYLLLVSITWIESKFYSAAIARERLITDLFVNYNAAVRPAPIGQRTDVSVKIELQHFDFRESDGAFHFVGLLDVRWHDQKLAWNPNDYNNLTKIPVSQKAIWVPDLEVYDNAPDKFMRMHRNGLVVLSHDGAVMWTDDIDITSFCTPNMRNWPHDRHECKMRFGSWTYNGLDLDIKAADPNTTMNFDNVDMENSEYKVTDFAAYHVSMVYSCCTEPYVSIDYTIAFERRSSYVIIFRASALAVIFLTLLALGMESWRGEKIWLFGISLVIIVFNLIYFASCIGRFARSTPLIVIYYSGSFVLVTLAQSVSVFSLLATRTLYVGKLPWVFSNFLKSSFVRFIAPTHTDHTKHEDHQDHADLSGHFEDVRLQESSNLIVADKSTNEWIRLAKVAERVALIVVGLSYLILGTICFV